jgi:hypothetical protein
MAGKKRRCAAEVPARFNQIHQSFAGYVGQKTFIS